MSEKVKTKSKPSLQDSDFKAALHALKRAGKRAQETARRAKTPIVLWKDGQVKAVRPGANGLQTQVGSYSPLSIRDTAC